MITSKQIDKLIKKRFIEETEIMDFMKLTSGDVFLLMKQSKNYKQQILISIYWNPVLLYNCSMVSEHIVENLISFMGLNAVNCYIINYRTAANA